MLGLTTLPAVDIPYLSATQENVSATPYGAALESIAPNITTMIDEQQAPGETWLDSLTRLLPIIAATEQQRQLLKVQTQRAAAGLPPLNMSEYAGGVNVGLSADTRQLLTYGGLALLAVLLLRGARR